MKISHYTVLIHAMHSHAYTHTHAHTMHSHAYTHTFIHVHTHTHTHVNARIHWHVHTRTLTQWHACAHSLKCTHTGSWCSSLLHSHLRLQSRRLGRKRHQSLWGPRSGGDRDQPVRMVVGSGNQLLHTRHWGGMGACQLPQGVCGPNVPPSWWSQLLVLKFLVELNLKWAICLTEQQFQNMPSIIGHSCEMCCNTNYYTISFQFNTIFFI